MKVIGITGYGKSGKTTLILKLLEELSKKGRSVAVLKHVSGNIDFPDTDTSKFKKVASFSSAISPGESEIILKGEKRLEDILKYCDSDIVLIEGFKREKSFPKIVCIKSEDEKSALSDGLQICTAGFDEDIVDFNISKEGHIKDLLT